MLTRSQVAARIGRSIATVRRLEGRRLHPEIDSRGFHRFGEDEVDRVAAEIMTTGRALSTGAFDSVAAEANISDEADDIQDQLDAALKENRDLEAQLDEALLRGDAAQNDLLSLKSDLKRWAKDIDQACAFLLKAETDEIQRLTVDALIEALEEMQLGAR